VDGRTPVDQRTLGARCRRRLNEKLKTRTVSADRQRLHERPLPPDEMRAALVALVEDVVRAQMPRALSEALAQQRTTIVNIVRAELKDLWRGLFGGQKGRGAI
jgi:hypothetical protein